MQLSSQEEIRILHVDDDPSVMDLAETFLEREDDRFSIETATSADEGLQRLTDRPPDCVVSDYNMPGMDGIEFLQTVRQEYPDLPFILYTGKGSEAVASEAIAADVTDYLQKQSGTEHYELLANRIENAVQSRREAERAERQEQLMRLTEFAGDTGGFEVDTETGDMLLTDGAHRILNVPEDETLSAEDTLEMTEPALREEIRQTMDQAVETGEQTHGVWPITLPNGEQRLLDVTYTPTNPEEDDATLQGAIRDITEQEERQRELRQLQQAIDNANVPITLADPSQADDPLVYVNDGFEEMTGYPPEEALGRNCRFLQGEDTDPEKVAALREAIDDEETISVELRNYRKDGTEFWNRLTITPIYDDDGNLVRYLGTQKDITEQKENRQKLALVETLFEHTEECQFIVDVADEEFKLRHANQYYKEIVGLPANTPVTGETPRELFGETGGRQVLDWYRRCVETQDSVSYTVELPVPEEGTVYRTILTPVTTDGEVTHIVGTARDITDRLDRQQELEAVNSQYQALVENFPGGGVFLLDQNMRFVRAGGDNLAKIGLNGADFEGNTPRDLYPGDVADEQIQYLEKTFDGENYTYRQEFRGKNYELRTMPIRDDTGEVVYAMAVSRDITQQVERKHEVQRQNERLEEFASIVSHDLRNPLQVAEGRLELIREECTSDHIDDVVQALDRMDALIEDLLTLAKEGDKVDETESVGLANVATNSWQTVNTEQATLETGTTQTIQADQGRLQQLFENLYRNAIEHGGDDITVSVGAMDDGFYVADTGSGIPESDREDVFEAGYSTNEDGTGFGLRIVEQIADAHGWEVAITESEEGGARFEITGVEKVE